MKMRIKIVLALMGFFMLFIGCSINFNAKNLDDNANSGVIVSGGDLAKATVNKTVRISDFDEIRASQGINIIFTQSSFNGTAAVRTTPSAEKYLSIEVKNRVLEVGYKNPKENIHGPTIVRVQSLDLRKVGLTSAASLTVEGNITFKPSGTFSINLTSAATVVLNNVAGGSVNVQQSSASNFTVRDMTVNSCSMEMTSASKTTVGKATVGKMNVSTTSAAQCDISKFFGNDLIVNSTSGSKVDIDDIYAGKVNAVATSGGHIRLKGESGKISTSSSSGGSVNRDKLYNAGTNTKNKGNNNTGASSIDNSGVIPPRKP